LEGAGGAVTPAEADAPAAHRGERAAAGREALEVDGGARAAREAEPARAEGEGHVAARLRRRAARVEEPRHREAARRERERARADHECAAQGHVARPEVEAAGGAGERPRAVDGAGR